MSGIRSGKRVISDISNNSLKDIIDIITLIYTKNYRKMMRPHEKNQLGIQQGTWKNNMFTPVDNLIPSKSNPARKTFTELNKDFYDKFGLSFNGILFLDGHADFSSISVAQIDFEEVILMQISNVAGEESNVNKNILFDSIDGINYKSLFGKRMRKSNFHIADKIAASNRIPIPGLPDGYTAKQLERWRIKNRFSWDESFLNGYLLVPRYIHDNISHTGLVSIMTKGDVAESNYTQKLKESNSEEWKLLEQLKMKIAEEIKEIDGKEKIKEEYLLEREKTKKFGLQETDAIISIKELKEKG